MSQGSRSDIVAYTDFLVLMDPTEVTIADGAVNGAVAFPFVLAAGGGEMGVTSILDEPGGVLQVESTGGDNEGPALIGPIVRPADGPVALEARFKVDDFSLVNLFVGFIETVDIDDFDTAGDPYTFSGTTLTDNNVGQVVGAHYDADATVDDWRALLSQDGATNAAVTASTTTYNGHTADNGGIVAGANLTATVNDDAWQLVRVEVDPDGAARVYVGNSSNDPQGVGPILIAEFGTGAGPLSNVKLTPTDVLHPVVWMEERSGAARTIQYDYALVTASRDWSV